MDVVAGGNQLCSYCPAVMGQFQKNQNAVDESYFIHSPFFHRKYFEGGKCFRFNSNGLKLTSDFQ